LLLFYHQEKIGLLMSHAIVERESSKAIEHVVKEKHVRLVLRKSSAATAKDSGSTGADSQAAIVHLVLGLRAASTPTAWTIPISAAPSLISITGRVPTETTKRHGCGTRLTVNRWPTSKVTPTRSDILTLF
jgi:hypothetical protein